MKKVAGTHLRWTPYFMLSVASAAELGFQARKQQILEKKKLPQKAAAELSTLQ